jgi:hypothetical protein
MVKSANGGKGNPLTYTLLPVSYIINLMKLQTKVIQWRQVNDDLATRFVHVFDEISKSKQSLNDILDSMNTHKLNLTTDDCKEAENLEREFKQLEMELKTKLKTTVTKIRKGEIDQNVLEALILQYNPTTNEIMQKLNAFIANGGKIQKKIAVINILRAEGAEGVDFGEYSWERIKLSKDKTYVLRFDEVSKTKDKKLWNSTLEYFRKLMSEFNKAEGTGASASVGSQNENKVKFYFANEDILKPGKIKGKGVRIMLIENGKIQSKDVYGDYEKLLKIPIVGEYILVDNGNLGAYLTAIGVPTLQWYAVMKANVTITISELDGEYTVITSSTWANREYKFELDKEFGEVTDDGYDCQSLVRRVGNKLYHTQKLIIGGEKVERETIREFAENGMKVILTFNGCTAHRIFKRSISD